MLDRERARREGPAFVAAYLVPYDRSEDLLPAGAGPGRPLAAVRPNASDYAPEP